jgi:hypothetical protein
MGIKSSEGGDSFVSQMGAGLFGGQENIIEAFGTGVAEMISEIVTGGDISSAVSNALETKTNVSNFSEGEKLQEAVAGNLLDYTEEIKGDINSNMMDYTDDLTGEVSTLALSRAGVESRLEQEQLGGDTTSIVPSMDEVAAYLMNQHDGKLDLMVQILGRIAENTGMRTRQSSIIGPESAGLPAAGRSGVKSMSRDSVKGYWDLLFSDYAPGVVNTEGRGGSA